jgi:hypothetical protein
MMKVKSSIQKIGLLMLVCIFLSLMIGATNEPPIMAYYYGTKMPVKLLRENTENLSCDDHLGKGILTCYNSFAEMLKANNCTMGPGRNIRCDVTSSADAKKSREFLPEGTLYAILWQHMNYSGDNFVCYFDYNDLRTVDFQDVTSSVDVFAGTILWEDINYEGNSTYLFADISDLRTRGFNDITSSVERYWAGQ